MKGVCAHSKLPCLLFVCWLWFLVFNFLELIDPPLGIRYTLQPEPRAHLPACRYTYMAAIPRAEKCSHPGLLVVNSHCNYM